MNFGLGRDSATPAAECKKRCEMGRHSQAGGKGAAATGQAAICFRGGEIKLAVAIWPGGSSATSGKLDRISRKKMRRFMGVPQGCASGREGGRGRQRRLSAIG